MASLNKVFLMGNLTRDPELSWTPGTNAPSVAVARFGLAVSERYKNRAGEQAETVCFVDVVVWRRQAETCAEYLKKGSPVLVEGRLQFDQWTSQQGEKRSRLRVRADRVQFLGSPRGAPPPAETSESPGQAEPPAPEEPAPESAGDEATDQDNLPF